MSFKKKGLCLVVMPVLVMLWMLAAVPAAFAHAHPVAYDPAPDSTVSAPRIVTMHFTEALEPKFSSISVVDASGHTVNSGPSQVSPSDTKAMTVALPHLTPGIYTVHWVSVALDSHRMQGDYKFTVK